MLTLRLVGSRKPPFLFQVDGIPAVIDDATLGEKREIVVETVEPVGESKSPEIASSLCSCGSNTLA